MSDMQMVVRTEADDYKPVMSIEDMLYQKEQLRQYVNACLVESKPGQVDGDYGTIPGAGTRKVLLLPGAQKLCRMRGLSPDYEILSEGKDWTGERHGGEPFFEYVLKCILFREDRRMGSGVGACNSFEEKYRYVKGERTCPVCGAGAIITGKKEYGGGFLCYAKKGGCGAKFGDNDPQITSQPVGKVEHPNPADLQNTILKMAKKRAYIDATLSVVGASEFFTQDVETEHPKPQERPQQPSARPAPPQRQEEAFEAEYVPHPAEGGSDRMSAADNMQMQRPSNVDQDGVVHDGVPSRPPLSARQVAMRDFRTAARAIDERFGHPSFKPEDMAKMVKNIIRDPRDVAEVGKEIECWEEATGILQTFKERNPDVSSETALKAIRYTYQHELPMVEFTSAMWLSPFPETAEAQ